MPFPGCFYFGPPLVEPPVIPMGFGGPVFYARWRGFNPMWASTMSWMDEDIYNAWLDWQDDIRGRNLDYATRKALLKRALIENWCGVYLNIEIERIATQIMGMEGDLGADQFGHVNGASSTTTITTTTSTVTQEQRSQFANQVLQQLTSSGSNVGIQKAQEMQQAILNGQWDDQVKTQLSKQQSGAAQQAPLQLTAPQVSAPQTAVPQFQQQPAPAPMQMPQQFAPTPMQNQNANSQHLSSQTVTTSTVTTSSNGIQASGQQMPPYQQPMQNLAPQQYQQPVQTPQAVQQLQYSQPQQITASSPAAHQAQYALPPPQAPQYQNVQPYQAQQMTQGGTQQYQQSAPQQQYAQQSTRGYPQQSGYPQQQQIAYGQPQTPGPSYQQALVPSSGQITKTKKPKKSKKDKVYV